MQTSKAILRLLGGASLFLCGGSARAQVVINEVFTGANSFIELRNLSPGGVDLSGWELSAFSGPSLNPDPGPFVLPPGTSISGSGFLVLEELGSPGGAGTINLGVNLAFAGTKAIEVVLRDDQGGGVDYLFRRENTTLFSPHKPADLTYLGVLSGSGNSIVRTQDHDSNFAQDWTVLTSLPTRGALNSGQSFGANPFRKVMITEVSWGDPDCLEISNLGGSDVDLTGWTVQWHDGTLQTSAPLDVILLAGESMVVRELAGGSLSLPAGTKELSLFPPLGTSSGALVVALRNQFGIVIDRVDIRDSAGVLPTFSIAGGFFTGGVKRSATSSGDVGVERIWGLDSDHPSDWTQQDQRSMGRENRNSGPLGEESPFVSGVVISEVSTVNGRFLELFNGGVNTFNLEGWFLLLSSNTGALHNVVAPFGSKFDLPVGGFVVMGDTAQGPSELPPGVPYIDLSKFGQFLPLSQNAEFEAALYTFRGFPQDVVRTTRIDSELVFNDPRAPSPPLFFTGAVRRTVGGGIARKNLAVDTDSASDFGAAQTRTMGSPAAAFLPLAPHADPLDVRLNSTGLRRSFTAILNAGSQRAGFAHHLLFSVSFTNGTGPVLGLGPDALFGAAIGVAPFSGTLDDDGSARVDLPPNSIPPGVLVETVWLLVNPATGVLTERTVVLAYGS